MSQISKWLRNQTLARDGYRCQCCGLGGEKLTSLLSFHHIVPQSAGGANTMRNGLTLCKNCHFLVHCCLDNKIRFTAEDAKQYTGISVYTLFAINAVANGAQKKKAAAKKQELRMSRSQSILAVFADSIMAGTNNRQAFQQALELYNAIKKVRDTLTIEQKDPNGANYTKAAWLYTENKKDFATLLKLKSANKHAVQMEFAKIYRVFDETGDGDEMQDAEDARSRLREQFFKAVDQWWDTLGGSEYPR